MKQLRTILLLTCVALSLASCAPQAQPRETITINYRAPSAKVFSLLIENIVHAPKPRGSRTGWVVTSRSLDNGLISARAYMRRADFRRNVEAGFARLDIKVSARNSEYSVVVMEATPGVATKLAQRLRGRVKRQLAGVQE